MSAEPSDFHSAEAELTPKGCVRLKITEQTWPLVAKELLLNPVWGIVGAQDRAPFQKIVDLCDRTAAGEKVRKQTCESLGNKIETRSRCASKIAYSLGENGDMRSEWAVQAVLWALGQDYFNTSPKQREARKQQAYPVLASLLQSVEQQNTPEIEL